MKTVANRLGMYADVRQILDAALVSGGGEFHLDTHGQAVHWRQRAYKFRKLFAETMTDRETFAMSPYDKLTMPKIAEESSTVEIKVREIVGTFKPAREPDEGMFIPIPGDELFDAAASIARKIKGGDL